MFNPSSFLGAVFVGLLGAGLFWLLQWGIRKVPHINIATPAGMILCMVIAMGTFLALLAIIISALPHGAFAQLLK